MAISKSFKKKQKAVPFKNLFLSEKSPFAIKEAYKTIRTNILYSVIPNKNKFIIVTSANPEEGKSTTSSNLAISLTQLQKKVILIDADMRKPTQHKRFYVNNNSGLSKVIAGFSSFKEAVHKDVIPDLDILTAGPVPPNPSELLSSENMLVLLDFLKQNYDYIIIDTPPLNVVTDAMVMMSESVATVLVCKQKLTTYDDMQKAIHNIKKTDTKFIGAVITAVKSGEKMYGGYAGKSYKNYEYK